MTRTTDFAHRSDVLDRITTYVVRHGLSDLSLRPLAKAVKLSPRTLLYHFGSKEAMVTAVLGRIGEEQMTLFERLRQTDLSTPGAICRAAWAYMTTPEIMPMVRLFFETYALALRSPKRFPGFLERVVEDWLEFLSAPLRSAGVPRKRARVLATIVLAGYRGFMLDFVTTADSKRIDSAVDAWVDSLQVITQPKVGSNAQSA